MHRGTPGHMRLHTDFKVKRSKVKVTGSISAPQRNVPIFRKRIKPFKFGKHIGRGQFLPTDHKLARNWASPGAGAPISKFWDFLNISQTGKATIFKFGTHIGRGQFLPPDHKFASKWAWPGVRDPISKFWDPLNISQTEKATKTTPKLERCITDMDNWTSANQGCLTCL